MKSRTIIVSGLIALFALAMPVRPATTLEWWQFWTDPAIKPVLQEIVAEFEAQNPDIKVNLTDLTWANGHEKIVIAFASGSAPDIVELGSDWIAQFADKGHLADLSVDIARDSAGTRGWSLATYNGKVYATPWFLGTRVMFWNKDLAALPEDTAEFFPVTWADVHNRAFQISKRKNGTFGWGSNAPETHRLYKKFMPYFWSAGAQIFSDDGKYCVMASTHAVEALTEYKFLHDSCAFVGKQRDIEDAFLDGKIGFIMSGDWLLKRIELEKRDLNFGTGLIPGPKFPGRSFLGGEYLAVGSSSKHKDEALKFMKFLTSAENQVKFCKANRSATPSSDTALRDPYFTSNEHLDLFNRQVILSVHPPVDPDWVEIESIIEEAVEDALFGSGKIAQPLLDAQRKIEKLKAL